MARKKREKIDLTKDSYVKAGQFLKYMKPYRMSFAIGFVFLILSSLTSMLFPLFTGQLFGSSTKGATDNKIDFLDFTNTNSLILMLFTIFVFQAVFSFFRVYLFSYTSENTLRDIRKEAFSRLIKNPVTFFYDNKVGELASRISNDINQLQDTINTTLAEFIRQIFVIFVGVIALFWIEAKLALIMLATVPVVAVFAVFFGRFIQRISKKAQGKAAESINVLEESFSGILNVKAFTNELYEITRFSTKVDDVYRLSMKSAIWRGVFISFIIFFMFGAIVFIIWRGVILMQAGELEIGMFISFIMYTIFLGASIGSMPDLYSNIKKAIGSTEHLMNLIQNETEEIDLGDTKMTLKGNVTFENIHFNYPSRPDVKVLDGLSFEVNEGEQIAIVGSSGAGKSTIASLLLRLFDPQSGDILFDGKSYTNYTLKDLRSNMSIVPQEVILFNGSIFENIQYGNLDASEEQVREAARKANALEFIQKFPEGFDTLVGDRGVQLSGGQRQRVAIARAILRDPSILILDEATSSLDTESEKLVQEALERLMKGRTSFVIAHRLSTIKNADRILVLDNGQINEAGTHEELIKKSNGIYHKLLSIQSGVEVNEE